MSESTLVGIVKSSEVLSSDQGATDVLLKYADKKDISKGLDNAFAYRLPLSIDLESGDRISFHHGDVSNEGGGMPRMTHDDYQFAVIRRNGKSLVTLKGIDMKILTETKKYAQKFKKQTSYPTSKEVNF